MEKKLILRGVIAGAIGGLLAFVFARIFAESQIQAAIDYESGRDDAQMLLDKATGLTVEEMGPDIFSRTIQANIGIGVGMILFGVAMGAIYAVVGVVVVLANPVVQDVALSDRLGWMAILVGAVMMVSGMFAVQRTMVRREVRTTTA